ncbi:capsule polysaccharide transporter [Caminibacter pacificus]|uniref:Capsular polysaccharide export protein n=1 Tax=Caminibacter pacificus TaxID=1424653 RepID=A0AAJ4RBM1_9BACT|nr:capsule polysaccharide transporter [Caminibacter pacificus]QCI29085.1 capsule polysaccharide transporter [Caminibacter pacificus]ROR39094.1 capsular polysaccharide export protein [Caminibacter pacificus]
MFYSTSIRLINRRAKNYKKYQPVVYVPPFFKHIVPAFDKNAVFLGWGYKKSGLEAMEMPKWLLLEDGFIRSVGLGVEGYPAFSVVEDDAGMHYDASKETRIERILKTYDFKNNEKLLQTARDAIELIKKYKISKYNLSPLILPEKVKKSKKKKVLIIAQTAGDNSLVYGRAYEFEPKDIILSALEENEGADVFVKVHPDVLTGKRQSSIDIDLAKKYCKVITENTNPVMLLEEFDKVYTQTSQMGFEAAFLGKEVVTFGMPFYAGWGITQDKLTNERRQRKLTPLEVFAAAYILYSNYYNPYEKRECEIIETIEEIKHQRDKLLKE